ncbi:hypothetical protein ACFU98_16110 [Streptomyces sp. NPDC057575]|uniref:hypothetical protein n=1 Tax=unclassified Streptomyces TaxID=2593676 RepID=UPI0036C2230A
MKGIGLDGGPYPGPLLPLRAVQQGVGIGALPDGNAPARPGSAAVYGSGSVYNSATGVAVPAYA